MFYTLDKYPQLVELVNQVDLISEEYLRLKNTSDLLEGFHHYPPDTPLEKTNTHIEYWIRENGIHPEQTGYEARNGEWVAFPIYKTGFPIKWYEVEKTFPLTYPKIVKIPGINFSAFFRIAPNSGSNEHTHTRSNLIFHLCLFDLDGDSVMRCGKEEKILSKKGDWCLFDYSIAHSSFNYSKKDRINLIIDFTPEK